MLLVGTLFWALLGALSGCGHDPNHDINMEQAREAADRVHPPPKPGVKRVPGPRGITAGKPGGSQVRLLLVEDEAAIACRTRESLEEARYTVDWAATASRRWRWPESGSMPPSSWT
jgi:hypothetical protein